MGGIPLFSVGTPYSQLPIQTEDPISRGALQGAEIAQRIPGMATSIARGFTEGVKDASNLADASARRELTKVNTAQQQLQLERDQAEQAQAIALKQKQNEAEMAKLAQEARFRKETDDLDADLQSNDRQRIREAVLGGKYPNAMSDPKKRLEAMTVALPAMYSQERDMLWKNANTSVNNQQLIKLQTKATFDADQVESKVRGDPVTNEILNTHPEYNRNAESLLSDMEFYPYGTVEVKQDGTLKKNDDGSVFRQGAANKGMGTTSIAVSKKTGVVLHDNVPGSPSTKDGYPALVTRKLQLSHDSRINGTSTPAQNERALIEEWNVNHGLNADGSTKGGSPAASPTPTPDQAQPQQQSSYQGPNHTVNRLQDKDTISTDQFSQIIQRTPTLDKADKSRTKANDQVVIAASKAMDLPVTATAPAAPILSKVFSAAITQDSKLGELKSAYVTTVLKNAFKEQAATDPKYNQDAVARHNLQVDDYTNKQVFLNQPSRFSKFPEMGSAPLRKNTTLPPLSVFPPHRVSSPEELFMTIMTPTVAMRVDLLIRQYAAAHKQQMDEFTSSEQYQKELPAKLVNY